jgi:hypothetical protein
MSRKVFPHVPLPAVDRKSNPLGPPPIVLDVVEDVVGVIAELDVEDVVGVIVELEVDEVVGVELEVDEVLGVGLELLVVDVPGVVDELEVVAGDDVLVVVGAPGLQLLGSGLTRPGTATASMQSVLKVVTQSTQSTIAPALEIGAAQLSDAKVVTAGQLEANPIALGATSPLPSHVLSSPPHALQIESTFFVSAFWMSSSVLPVASAGHVIACRPFKRASQHFCNAFERAPRNLTVDLPIAC